jgi:hypothetical protein
MNTRPGPVPDLTAAGRTPVLRWRLHPVNAVDILPGGLVTDDAIAYLRLIDVPNATAYLAPLNERQLYGLTRQIADLQTASRTSPNTTAHQGRKEPS